MTANCLVGCALLVTYLSNGLWPNGFGNEASETISGRPSLLVIEFDLNILFFWISNEKDFIAGRAAIDMKGAPPSLKVHNQVSLCASPHGLDHEITPNRLKIKACFAGNYFLW
jgi:hypothetical protein